MPINLKLPTTANDGWTNYRYVSAASTGATVVKASAGIIASIQVVNTATTTYWLKFYDKATSPTVGTDTPALVFPIIGNNGGMATIIFQYPGVKFASGIGHGIAAGGADNNTSAPGAGAVLFSMQYM